jgi:hypothetical protein
VGSGRDVSGLGGGIASRRDSGRLGGGRVASRRDSSGLGRIAASGRDSGGLGGGTVASRRGLGGLGWIVASGRDSTGAGGSIEGFGRVHAVARFLGGTLGSNCCKAFRFVSLLALEVRQGAQVANNLPVEPFFAKEEAGRFW